MTTGRYSVSLSTHANAVHFLCPVQTQLVLTFLYLVYELSSHSAAMAFHLRAGVALVRKPGKLPAAKISQSYGLEYGVNTIEMHTTAVQRGQRGAVC